MIYWSTQTELNRCALLLLRCFTNIFTLFWNKDSSATLLQLCVVLHTRNADNAIHWQQVTVLTFSSFTILGFKRKNKCFVFFCMADMKESLFLFLLFPFQFPYSFPYREVNVKTRSDDASCLALQYFVNFDIFVMTVSQWNPWLHEFDRISVTSYCHWLRNIPLILLMKQVLISPWNECFHVGGRKLLGR